jgi:hypothetical protein
MRCFSSMGRVLVLALSLTASHAWADITYTFSGVTFSDGGTLNGTFTANDAINSVLNYNITTSPNTGIGFTYTPATASSAPSALPFILVLNAPALSNILQVTFTNLLSTGAPITIGTFDSFEQTPAARRDIVTGSVIVAAIPEPETYAMLLAGLGLVGFMARRRKQQTA